MGRLRQSALALLLATASLPLYALPAQSQRAVVSIAPEADARVAEASPTTNYGTSSYLRTDGGADPDVESYLRFTVTGVSDPVESAKLRVFATTGSANGPAAYATSNSWSETGITWSNRPARTSGPRDDKAKIVASTWVEFDVTPLVAGNGTYSFVLATTSSDGVDFNSRQAAGSKPELVVTTAATTVDTEAPSPPTNLTATPTSATQVDLSWSAATDNVGVTGYDLYRDGSLLATLGTGTTYSDTTVTASTTYTYEVKARDAAGNVSGPSNSATITTPPGGTGSVVIAAAGDLACAPTDPKFGLPNGPSPSVCQTGATADLIGSGVDKVLALGDDQYEDATLSEFQASYDRTWGAFKPKTAPVPGNHEYFTPGAQGYFDYFGDLAHADSNGYYSYNLGSWHMVALNSECALLPAGGAANGCALGSPQETWLRNDLAADNSPCTLAYWHKPGFYPNKVGAFVTDLYNDGAEVILSAHNHNYERFAPQTPAKVRDDARGVVQVVVGTGGKSHHPFTTVAQNSLVRNDTAFGVLTMTLKPDGYDLKFTSVDGSFSDSDSRSCH